MNLKRSVSLCIFALQLMLVSVGCRQQSSAPQPTSSPAADASASVAANATAAGTPAANSPASLPAKGEVDACKLLTAEEIKSVQGDTLQNVTASPMSRGAFITSQCFYATGNFVNSVSLTVTQQASGAGAEDLKEFWEERFASAEGRGKGERERERERERDRAKSAGRGEAEEEEEGAPPEKVKGIGDEAFSVGNAKIGALYVLKGDKFLRISVGGSRSQPERISKMKALAQYVLKRL